MRFFSRKTVVFAAALAAFAVSGCSREPEGPDYVLTYAENQPEDYATTLGAYEFARLVEAETDGRIVIRVVSDGELGDEDALSSSSTCTVTGNASLPGILPERFFLR